MGTPTNLVPTTDGKINVIQTHRETETLNFLRFLRLKIYHTGVEKISALWLDDLRRSSNFPLLEHWPGICTAGPSVLQVCGCHWYLESRNQSISFASQPDRPNRMKRTSLWNVVGGLCIPKAITLYCKTSLARSVNGTCQYPLSKSSFVTGIAITVNTILHSG